jgi:hypothetical protein
LPTALQQELIKELLKQVMETSILSKTLSSVVRFLLGSKPDFSYGLIQKLGIDKDLSAKNWDAFEKKLESLDAEDLTRAIDGICLGNRYDNLLKKYIALTDSQLRSLISGAYNLHIAWLKRGGQLGASLSNNQISGFEKYLEIADADLSVSFDNPIYEAEAKARRIRVKMGMGEGAKAQEVFQGVINVNPGHLLAHLNYFKVVSPKWLGDAEILYDLVKSVENQQLKNLLRLMYIVELYSDKYYDAKGAKENYDKIRHGFLALALSEINPSEGDSLLDIYTNNYLACLYRISNKYVSEFKMNKYLLGRRTVYPWAYFG